jgi:hypothetical protein
VFTLGLGGEQRKWGTQTVRKGKSLVRLKKVHLLSAKTPFSFSLNWQGSNGAKAWKKRSLTLQKVLEEFGNPLILALTSKLSLSASSICFQRDENNHKEDERKEEVGKAEVGKEEDNLSAALQTLPWWKNRKNT